MEALEAIRQECPDLLITDIYMLEMDGIQLIEQAQQLGVKHYAILIGYDEFTLAQRALRLRTMDYLLKSIDKEQLYHLMDKAIALTERKNTLVWEYLRTGLRLLCQFGVAESDLPAPLPSEAAFGDGTLAALVLLDAAAADAQELYEELDELRVLACRFMPLGRDQNQYPMFLMAFPDSWREEIPACE